MTNMLSSIILKTRIFKNLLINKKFIKQMVMCYTNCTLSSGYLKINRNNLFYEKCGNSSKSILCIPGALGSGRSDFSYQLEELSNDFTVVAFDPRGYGKSKQASRKFDLDFFETDADDAANVMNALGYSKYSVLGWSDGGIVGMILASKENKKVENLVVWGSNSYVCDEDKELIEKTRDLSKWSERMRAPLEAVYGKEGLQKLWDSWMDAFFAFANNPNGSICIPELRKINCSTLIVHGMKDALVPYFHAEFLKNNIHNSTMVTYPNGKHNLHMRYHEEFNTLVKDFISKGEINSKL